MNSFQYYKFSLNKELLGIRDGFERIPFNTTSLV